MSDVVHQQNATGEQHWLSGVLRGETQSRTSYQTAVVIRVSTRDQEIRTTGILSHVSGLLGWLVRRYGTLLDSLLHDSLS